MNIIERLKQRAAGWLISAAAEEHLDWRRGLERYRPPTRLTQQDEDFEGNRDEMISEARSLCASFGLAKRILRSYANYVVGSCEINFSSGDKDWDERAEGFWRDSMKIIDASGKRNFRGMAKLAIKSMIRDGDVGFIKTKRNGYPQLEAIEADRVRNTQSTVDVDEDGHIGGVTVNERDMPISYRVWKRQRFLGFHSPMEVMAPDFIHLADPERFDGIRGITHFHNNALNHMRDLKELITSEKKAVKTANRIALLIKRAIAGVQTSKLNLFGTSQDGTKTHYSEEIPDGVIKYLQPGEEAETWRAERPSSMFQGFVELLIRDIAIGLDLPYGFVWTMTGLTGPGVRFEMKQAERTFQDKFELLDYALLTPTALWVLGDGIDTGKLDFHPRWFEFEFQMPASPSIDVGRESVADLNEHARGILSGSDIAAPRGRNIYKVIDRKVREARYAIDAAAEADVPIQMVIDTAPGSGSVADPMPPDDDEPQGNRRPDEQRQEQQQD